MPVLGGMDDYAEGDLTEGQHWKNFSWKTAKKK